MSEVQQMAMQTIKLMATAGFCYVAKSANVRRFLADNRHSTINGTNWSYDVIDAEQPAFIEGEIAYQFGSPRSFRVEYTPGLGWEEVRGGDRRESNGYVKGF